MLYVLHCTYEHDVHSFLYIYFGQIGKFFINILVDKTHHYSRLFCCMDIDIFLVYFHLKRPFIGNAHTNIYAQSHFGQGNNELFDYRRLGMFSFILKTFHLKIRSLVHENRALPPPGKI